MNIAGFYPESISNGEGFRAVVFVSGCSHNCPSCQNKDAQNACYGKSFTKEYKQKLQDEIVGNYNIKGITLSGGEPFEEYNTKELYDFVKQIIYLRPDFNVWAYSGYKYDQLLKCSLKSQLLSVVDILVDGKFILSKKTNIGKFIGSTNQRIIDVKKSLSKKEVVLYSTLSVLDKFDL